MVTGSTRTWVRCSAAAAVVLLAGCTATGVGTTSAGAPSPTSAVTTTTSAPPSRSEAPGPTRIVVSPALGTTEYGPADPLVVSVEDGTLTEVTVRTESGERVPGALSPDRDRWTAAEKFGYGRSYSVTARAVDAGGESTQVSGTVGTARPATLAFASALPNPEITEVGVAQPIALYFDEAVTDRAAVERRLRVTSTPPAEGAWSWLSDTEVHYRPQTFWPAGAHVEVDVALYGVHLGNGIYGERDRYLEFDVHDALEARVDSDELLMRVYRNGTLVRTIPTSLGKPGSETYSGRYVVMDQHVEYTMDSSTYGVPIDADEGYEIDVEYASRLSYTGIFVHAAPWSVPDQGVRNVSHGCLNVSTEDAQWFYENFGRGDLVEVTGTGRALEPTDGFGDWNVTWADWLAGSALA